MHTITSLFGAWTGLLHKDGQLYLLNNLNSLFTFWYTRKNTLFFTVGYIKYYNMQNKHNLQQQLGLKV